MCAYYSRSTSKILPMPLCCPVKRERLGMRLHSGGSQHSHDSHLTCKLHFSFSVWNKLMFRMWHNLWTHFTLLVKCSLTVTDSSFERAYLFTRSLYTWLTWYTRGLLMWCMYVLDLSLNKSCSSRGNDLLSTLQWTFTLWRDLYSSAVVRTCIIRWTSWDMWCTYVWLPHDLLVL